MDINAKAIILWILYQILGLDGFRIGNVVPNRNLESVMKDMQVDNIHMPNSFSHIRTASVNNRLKRFFEFNPVAFNHDSSEIPDKTTQPNMFHFSPFITSLQNFKKHTKQHKNPVSKFKSIYIKSGEKPKKLRPYVDHFSGVKSFALQLMNPIKEHGQDLNDYSEKPDIPEQSISDISMRAFLKPNTENVFAGSAVVISENIPYKESNKKELETNLNKIIKPENNTNIYNGDYILTNSAKTVNSADPASKGNVFGEIYDISSPQMSDWDNFDFGHFEDNTASSSSVVDHSEDGFEYFDKNSKSEPYLNVPLDFQSNEQSIESLYPDTNEIGFHGETDSSMDSYVLNDQHFGDFIGPNANNFDHTVEGFGEFKTDDSKPYFGVDPQLEDGFQSFEQNFGSFSYDTDDCDTIDTKACASNGDCTCYGFYQCKENKCISNSISASDFDSQQSPNGQWDEEPVDFDSWKK